jgi:hypothetical protein
VMVRRASAERALVMRDLQRMQRTHLQLKHRSEPVSAPVHIPRPLHVTAG